MFWLSLLVLLLLAFQAPASVEFVPGEILLKPRPNLAEAELESLLTAHGARQQQLLPHLNVRLLSVPEPAAPHVLAALADDPRVEFAERNFLAHAAFLPNDPYVTSGLEWHLARIQAPQAWDLVRGNTNVIIGIIDSGINAAHPDLAGRVLAGYNFVANTANPADDYGHGTAVAGTVAALGNNGQGVAGVAFGCYLLPVKVLDATGSGSYANIANGITYAANRGARVINISIAGSSPSTTLQSAVDYAWSKNAVVAVAVGNNSNSIVQYPAGCSNVVGVSALQANNALASFSNFGKDVALSAPGDVIWTTQMNLANPYGNWWGTSFASPVVAGVAALVAAANPRLANRDIVSILKCNADDLGQPGYDQAYGYGRVNAYRAVTAARAAAPVLRPLTRLGTTNVTLSWSAASGRTYRVQYKSTPNATNWTTLSPDLTATNSLASRTDSPLGASQRFYRVQLLP